MTDTMSTGSMDLALKDSGVIVDMTPSALLQHSALALHTHALRSLKESTHNQSDDHRSSCALTTSTTTAAGNSTSNNKHASPVGLSASLPLTTFRCERCDNFETNSRAALLLHVVQCLSSPARLKSEDPDPENLSIAAGGAHAEHGSCNGEQQAAASNSSSEGPVLVNGGVVGGVGSSMSASSSTSSASRKVFECDVCNMKFSNGANMRRHKMRHTGVKPYECRVCQKRFFRKDHLAEHFTTHTKTLPYHCPICNRGFQRQIAMRAHFQNEHVGQHDLVKTCPLCSYRAGSMKSLRIHFFNRHGIDLDNPGPGGTSSLLLALESQASQVAAAAAAAGFVPALNAVNVANAANVGSVANASHQSDSGESLRSMENATPPMHFLTPHVEISTVPDNGVEQLLNGSSAPGDGDSGEIADKERRERHDDAMDMHELKLDSSNLKTSLPSSTSSQVVGLQLSASPKNHLHQHNHQLHQHHNHHENHITPSISLIPIKQEPLGEDLSNSDSNKSSTGGSSAVAKTPAAFGEQAPSSGGDTSETDYSSSNNRLTSLIKVSPLKSLLREDLKRRICAKANNRMSRNAAALENNNIVLSSNNNNGLAHNGGGASCNATPICNGTITSSGQETDSSALSRKQILTCLFCGIEFPDETLYFLHKGCHCESNPWKCNICGEQCNNVYEFNSHLLSKSHQ